jgi:hypothetical protein
MTQPLSNAANFVVFNSEGALVNDSFRFSRVRVLAFVDARENLVISMAVATGYSDLSRTARVLLNGVLIGVVDPYPLGNPSFALHTMTIVVPANKIPPPFETIMNQTVAVLEIVTTNSDPDNWLLVDSVVCHFHVQGANV